MIRRILALCVFVLLVAESALFKQAVAWESECERIVDATLKDLCVLAEFGNAEGQLKLGVAYALGQGVVQNYAEAAMWFRFAAEQGDAGAQHNLGFMYLNGHGVLQNYAEAAEWFRRAAEQGFADAQNNLGILHVLGQGVLRDAVYAHMWVNIAAANGSEGASEARNIIEQDMTREQIAEAQRLARECVRKDYKDC